MHLFPTASFMVSLAPSDGRVVLLPVPKVWTFASFELDELRFELRRWHTLVTVQPLILHTILHLVKNRHRLVTRAELIAGPWRGNLVSDAAIDRAIKFARKALSDEGSRQEMI